MEKDLGRCCVSIPSLFEESIANLSGNFHITKVDFAIAHNSYLIKLTELLTGQFEN
jgi:hypothetical protein